MSIIILLLLLLLFLLRLLLLKIMTLTLDSIINHRSSEAMRSVSESAAESHLTFKVKEKKTSQQLT